jgi:hypothetical protein
MLYALALRTATAALRRVSQRAVNTVTTNVPGPPSPLYALGREMLEYLPFVPLSQGVRIGVAILSYNGKVRFGVTGDYDTLPEVPWFCARIEACIAELAASGRRSTSARSNGGRAEAETMKAKEVRSRPRRRPASGGCHGPVPRVVERSA